MKIVFLRISVLAGILAFASNLAFSDAGDEVLTQRDSNWSSFLGPDGNGISRETRLVRAFPDSGPKIVWRVNLGTGHSGLTIAEGRVFTLFGRDGREHVACFDAEKGDSIWTIDIDADFAEGRCPGPRSTPCVDFEGNKPARLYAVGASGQLVCLDAESGKALWKVNLPEKFDFRVLEEGIAASPFLDGERLIIAAGKSVFAFDKKTGDLRWRSLDEPMSHSSPMVRTINGTKQLIVLTGQNLVGLTPSDGTEVWRSPHAGTNVATPVVGPNDQIFVGAAYGAGCRLIRVKGDEADEIYKSTVLAPHMATPILYKGHLYGFDDRPGILKCVEFATGKEVWNTRRTVKGNMVLADDQLIIFNEAGELILAPATSQGFEPTAKHRLVRDGLFYSAPTLHRGRLYVRSDLEMIVVDLRRE